MIEGSREGVLMQGPEGHLPGTPCLLPGPSLSLPNRLSSIILHDEERKGEKETERQEEETILLGILLDLESKLSTIPTLQHLLRPARSRRRRKRSTTPPLLGDSLLARIASYSRNYINSQS